LNYDELESKNYYEQLVRIIKNSVLQHIPWYDLYPMKLTSSKCITSKAMPYRHDVQSNAFLLNLSNFFFIKFQYHIPHS